MSIVFEYGTFFVTRSYSSKVRASEEVSSWAVEESKLKGDCAVSREKALTFPQVTRPSLVENIYKDILQNISLP